MGNRSAVIIAAVLIATAATATAAELPDRYFRLLDAGIAHVERQLVDEPSLDFTRLEMRGDGWRLFPHVILAASVLYAKQDAANRNYRNPRMLSLAIRIGDRLASDSEAGSFQERLNSDRDAYMWLESYRILAGDLGAARRKRWQRELERGIAELAADSAARIDFPGYNSPFNGTSPNHLSLWASTVYLAGCMFNKPEWEKIGASVMHRFAAKEQSADGYWGEHENALPTPGYDYTTYTGVALYAEHSSDPAALQALRRGLDFHKYFTYPDGTPVDVLDDRNRYTIVPGWNVPGFSTWRKEDPPPGGNDESASKGHFGFSRFPDGRRYAEFLTGFFRAGEVGYEDLGRLAQNALYYHRGPKEAIPQDLARYWRRLSIPAGIRKSGPWVACLSGIVSTQAVNNQFYLDRQGSVSVFHEKLGLIVIGANSKNQPELATFSERLQGRIFHLPVSSRLDMTETRDRLSLAYNTFFADLFVPPPEQNNFRLRFVISGKGSPAEEPLLTLQLRLMPGEILETATGKSLVVGAERIELSPVELGGWIRHHGWTLRTGAEARLVWPVYPFDPYANGFERDLQHAVGALSVPLRLAAQKGRYVRPNEQEISFELGVKN